MQKTKPQFIFISPATLQLSVSGDFYLKLAIDSRRTYNFLSCIQRVLTFRMGNINFVIITGKLGECVRQEKVISGGGGGGGVRGGGKGI